MNTLISFLGKQNNGYRETRYQLNGKEFVTKFMGANLAKAIQTDKLLLVGTAGSMWDVFFEEHGGDDELVIQLIDDVKSNQVSEDLLQKLTPKLQEQLGCEVRCIVIEYARDNVEQIALLHRIANELDQNSTLSLDVTHGFRHLPMLALVAARFLKNSKNIQTNHIYYGAFEMGQNGITPVIDLSGLLTMLDWVDALSAYKQSDNYAAFSPLLHTKHAEFLNHAAFFENINQVHNARSPLTKFQTALQNGEIDNPFISLVQEDLNQRTQWAKGSNQYEHQINLAKRNLDNGDYLQASIRANEAWISKVLGMSNQEQSDYNNRENVSKNPSKHFSNADCQLFEDLKAIRNAMAHGTKATRPGITDILSHEEKLKNKLDEIIYRIGQWKY